ncbi:MAG: nucleoside deaminase [Methylobacteriaceae bacterium]|nr:nucleoside deaminase [Methylobacteriaceae bacterium]MBV9218447.1 nucleoside deaminase [Methylobacteriaceae bacterium]MBV9247461.1 nucleoside deaminase [Methylobacteriaceae bacterium]MBV9704376.1 nucleoside deaminase [Methylobacteriaceae bacterium]
MPDSSDEDHRFLREAVRLSRERMEAGFGGPFGAIIVQNGKVLAEGWNEVTSALDPTAHAEVTAIRRACHAVGDFSLPGATIYSSCEPCPMCLAAIYWARLERLVFANTRGQASDIGFDDALIYDEMPKHPMHRRLATTHLPLAEADAVFDAWVKKADKIAY